MLCQIYIRFIQPTNMSRPVVILKAISLPAPLSPHVASYSLQPAIQSNINNKIIEYAGPWEKKNPYQQRLPEITCACMWVCEVKTFKSPCCCIYDR